MKRNFDAIQIWRYDQVPQGLKRLSEKNSSWVALIPPNLARLDSEALFLKAQSDRRPVVRQSLADGSVLFSGGCDEDV